MRFMDWRELDNFIRGRGASMACPACPEGKLEPGSKLIGLVTLDNGNLNLNAATNECEALQCLQYLCGNCGYIRLHAPQVFDS